MKEKDLYQIPLQVSLTVGWKRLLFLFCFASKLFFFPGNTLSFTLFSGVLHGSHCSASWQALLSIVFLISVSLITLKQNNYIRNRLKQITEAILHLTPKYLQQ